MKPLPLLAGCSAVALAIVLYTALSPDGYGRMGTLQGERAALSQRVAELKADNARLMEEASSLQEDAETTHLERVVREELGYVKPDEVVLLMDEPARSKR